MAREDSLFKLRIPEALKARVEASAKANGRTKTAEINYRVEEAYDIAQKLMEIDAKLDQLLSRFDALENLKPKG